MLSNQLTSKSRLKQGEHFSCFLFTFTVHSVLGVLCTCEFHFEVIFNVEECFCSTVISHTHTERWQLSADEQLHMFESILSITAVRDEFSLNTFASSHVYHSFLHRPQTVKHRRLLTAQKVWRLSCSLGMTHISWDKIHGWAVLPEHGWRAHRGRQSTRWETRPRRSGWVPHRAAAQRGNEDRTRAQTSRPLVLCEPASPPSLKEKCVHCDSFVG